MVWIAVTPTHTAIASTGSSRALKSKGEGETNMHDCSYDQPGKAGTSNHSEPSGERFAPSPSESGQGLTPFEACTNHLSMIRKNALYVSVEHVTK
jgi:hypothetical protein